jgi:hypothetical protein
MSRLPALCEQTVPHKNKEQNTEAKDFVKSHWSRFLGQTFPLTILGVSCKGRVVTFVQLLIPGVITH